MLIAIRNALILSYILGIEGQVPTSGLWQSFSLPPEFEVFEEETIQSYQSLNIAPCAVE